MGLLERLWWRTVHVFGIHTPIEAVDVGLDEDKTVRRITRRVECAVCGIAM